MLIITNELSMLIIKFKEIKILKNVWKQTKMKHSSAEPLGCSKLGSKREVYSKTGLSQETGKVPNTQSNLT